MEYLGRRVVADGDPDARRKRLRFAFLLGKYVYM